MHRVVVFTNDHSWAVPAILIKSTLAALDCRDDVEFFAVCVPKPPAFRAMLIRHLRDRAFFSIFGILAPSFRRRHTGPPLESLSLYAKRHCFKVLIPPNGDINDPSFIELLSNKIRPTLALSYFCLQRFSTGLLEVFDHAVNYHNGLLPEYRGLNVTAWSLYYGKMETGFTFHRMTDRFDEGPILFQDTVPVHPEDRVLDLECDKAFSAAARIPHVLSMVLDGAPGEPQQGKGNYFSAKTCLAVQRIGDPSSISSVELKRRLRAFDRLDLRLAGRWYCVTKLTCHSIRARKSTRFCFLASDGIMMEATRFRYLPYPAYRVFEFARRRHP